MTPIHSVVVTIGLFMLTFLSPGPNLLVVAQSSLSFGRTAGIAVGLGVAVGDAVYAAFGLIGMAAVIAQSGELLAIVKVIGGLYLLWMAWKLLMSRRVPAMEVHAPIAIAQPPANLFLRGLLTDLANPQTVLFFAGIFAITLTSETPTWVKVLSWIGIFLSSALWRIGLSFAFSQRPARAMYIRWRRNIERLTGAALGVFGARLLIDGMS